MWLEPIYGAGSVHYWDGVCLSVTQDVSMQDSLQAPWCLELDPITPTNRFGPWIDSTLGWGEAHDEAPLFQP